MNRVKGLDLLTDILLGSVLISIFAFSFFLTHNLSPQQLQKEAIVLGTSSSQFRLLEAPSSFITTLDSDESELKFRIDLDIDTNKLINDYRVIELRNTSNVLERYALYFDLSKEEFKDIQLFLVNEKDSYPIFQARSEDLTIKDVVIEISPQSMSRYALRSVYMNEELPSKVDLEIMVKRIN